MDRFYALSEHLLVMVAWQTAKYPTWLGRQVTSTSSLAGDEGEKVSDRRKRVTNITMLTPGDRGSKKRHQTR